MSEEKMMDMAEAERLSAIAMSEARGMLVLTQPFVAMIAMPMKMFPDWGCETLWTDSERIGFNPDFVLAMTPGQRTFAIAHEVYHVTLLHPFRRGSREEEDWNTASDYMVNPILLNSGVGEAIDGMLLDSFYDGKSAEMAYEIVRKRPKEQVPGPPKQGEEGKEGRGGEGSGGGEGGKAKEDKKGKGKGKDPGKKEKKEKKDKGKGKGKGGGDGKGDSKGKGDKPQPPRTRPNLRKDGDKPTPNSADPGGCGEVRDWKPEDGSTPTDGDKNNRMEEVKIRIASAAQAAEGMGSMPAGLARIIGEMLEPKVDYREYIQCWAKEVVKDDYSWSRPNARYMAATGFYLPALHHEVTGKIGLFNDTSGSRSDEQVTEVAGELQGVCKLSQTPMIVIHCDTSVTKECVEEIRPEMMPVKLHPRGGGGTDFRPPFDYIEKHDVKLAGALYYTDGECNRFPDPPDYPVLWVLASDCRMKTEQFQRAVPFGDVIKIPRE